MSSALGGGSVAKRVTQMRVVEWFSTWQRGFAVTRGAKKRRPRPSSCKAHPTSGRTPMWSLADRFVKAVSDVTVGTVIVLFHVALADRNNRQRRLAAGENAQPARMPS
ncbi:MAG: hypothetical protein KIT31_18040 [Deltaproteobacteria bacterium]|nr:hypothetical protein [Deltaproteobacteria bacterium]